MYRTYVNSTARLNSICPKRRCVPPPPPPPPPGMVWKWFRINDLQKGMACKPFRINELVFPYLPHTSVRTVCWFLVPRFSKDSIPHPLSEIVVGGIKCQISENKRFMGFSPINIRFQRS